VSWGESGESMDESESINGRQIVGTARKTRERVVWLEEKGG